MRRGRLVLLAVLNASLVGCASLGGGEEDRSSRLLATNDSIGIAWVPSGLYSLDTARGSANSELQLLDPETGVARTIPWPDEPCEDSFRSGPYPGVDGRVHVAQVCNYLVGGPPREGSYLAYDPTDQTWSTLTPDTWEAPSHGALSWDPIAQEGLFTTPDQSCSTVYRLTDDGPALIEQVVPTPLGDVDLRAGAPLEREDGSCLRDGRILGAPANAQGQVALMVSPVRGPAGPGRLDAESALVLASWTPGGPEPLSGFRTLVEDLQSVSPPVWSPDGAAVFFSAGDSITRVDAASGQVAQVAEEGADQLAVSPDGTRLALRYSRLTDDESDVESVIRVLPLDGTS